jgi:hypothetical protein
MRKRWIDAATVATVALAAHAGRPVAAASAVRNAAAAPGVAAGAIVASGPTEPRLSPPAALAVQAAFHSGDRRGADSLLTAWDATAGRDPLPALVRYELAWWDVLEGRDDDGGRTRALEAALDSVDARSAARFAADPDDVAALWAFGEAHCAAGRLAGLGGHGWSALRHHQRGVAALERVRRLHPDAAEPRASLGVFRYYAARLPGPVRMLGRLVRVRGDRVAALADLRAAAAAPGMQQMAARFFLAQILNDGEAENWEAHLQALGALAAAPARLAVVLKLADVLADLERPDLAVALVLQPAAGDDSCAVVQRAFLAGRIECDSGRPAAALERFERLSPRDVARVGWLEPWWETYRGIARAALGDSAAARRHWRRATVLPDQAGSRTVAAQAAARFASPLEPARVAALGDLRWDGHAAAAHARLQAARAANPTARADAVFDATAGDAALRAGDTRAARTALARAARDDGDDAELRVRARVRWLQTLLWSGDTDAARAAAASLRAPEGTWAYPRQLAWLVETILDPAPPAFAAFAVASAGSVAMPLRLADTGFTSVAVEVRGGGTPVPLVYHDGFWTGSLPVPAGRTLYRFQVEGRHTVLDPESTVLDTVQGETWSVRFRIPTQ